MFFGYKNNQNGILYDAFPQPEPSFSSEVNYGSGTMRSRGCGICAFQWKFQAESRDRGRARKFSRAAYVLRSNPVWFVTLAGHNAKRFI